MKQLDTNDMIGYKAPSEKIKSHNVDRLIGVKNLKFYNLPPMKDRTKEDTLEDFKMKYDNRKNDTPYDLHEEERDTDSEVLLKMDRRERAYSIFNQVEGYREAGSTRAKIGSSLGIGRSKRALARQKRAFLINKAGDAATKLAENARPDIDPNAIRTVGTLTTRLVGDAANSISESSRKKKKQAAKDKKKEDKILAKSRSRY